MGFVGSGRGGFVRVPRRVGDELVMRTFRWNAPIIIGAGALVLSVFALAPLPLKAGESGAEVTGALEGRQLGLNELKARLDQSDRAAAMQALDLALSELGDGVTLVWRRPERELVGRIKPVSAFRDDQAAFAAMSSTRSRSAPISGRSKALLAGSLTAPGLFGVNGGLDVSSQSGRGCRFGRFGARKQGRSRARRRQKSGSRRSGRARSIPSRKCGSTGADRAVSPPFASAGGDGTKRLSSRRWPQSACGIKPFGPAVAAL